MAKIVHLSVKPDVPENSYWDMTMLHDFLEGMPDSERTVVLIPGAYQYDVLPEINMALQEFPKVLVFITSDEEEKFDCNKLHHPDMIHYHQYGTKHCDRAFPIGYTSDTRRYLKEIGLKERDIMCFFAGQLNSDERRRMFAQVAQVPQSVLFGTDGFARGLKPREYYDYMASAKFVPTPGGHISPDSFRFYEALEAGTVPLFIPEYLEKMFPDMPMSAQKSIYKAPLRSEVFSWWIAKKQEIKRQLKKDLNINEAMTIVVPTSPIPSHPSTEIIEETIKSIRHHTAMEIIITIDGVREEQTEMLNDYTKYIEKLLWKCNFEWDNVTPILFDKHAHQSGMMKKVLEIVTTPLILYVEHDTPLVTDEEIDWGLICETVMSDKANVVRFHYEAQIPEPHQYLMMPEHNMDKFIATRQWSQRPHVAKTAFYKDIMQFFSEEANCFIEDRIYGQAVEAPFEDWKIFIYAPGDNIKRSLNLDGRANDTKYDDKQVW